MIFLKDYFKISRKNFVPRDRVDFETARALKLLGMPQGFVINDKNIARLHEPHYVTIYSANMIHSYIPDLNIGHIHSADVMCYAPTKEEACRWLLSKIKSEKKENNNV